MIQSLLEKFTSGERDPQEKFKKESLEFAQSRLTMYAGQPIENQLPIATYNARWDPNEPEEPGAYFDIATVKPGSILRLNLGGYYDELRNKPTDEIYEYIVAGKRDDKGKLMLYEVYHGNPRDFIDNTMPGLQLTPYGFRLEELDYKIDKEPYNSTQFPIYLAKDYLKAYGLDWTDNWQPGSTTGSLWPDPYIPNSIDMMMAGIPDKKPEIAKEGRAVSSYHGIGSLIPQPTRG